ncbi:MAG: prepilin peptidase [Fimbriimonadaceae bacterium]
MPHGGAYYYGLFPEWTCIVGLWVGACIGSFLNVVIYRMPRGMSLNKPRSSICPSCKHPLGMADLMPIVSWLFIDHRPEALTWGIPIALAGWITGVGVLWGIAFLGRILFKKDAMGHGDIKMSRGVGAVLFPAVATISFGLAVALGAVIGTIMILVGRAMESKAKASLAANGEAELEETEEEEAYEPESIASLLKSGLGYLIGIDIIGLFSVKLYENWFGENPYDVPEDLDTFKPSLTMIPFGPYLALGAIIAAVFSRQLLGAVENYLNLQPNGAFLWEHFQRVACLNLLG